jgi:hypothetical protein
VADDIKATRLLSRQRRKHVNEEKAGADEVSTILLPYGTPDEYIRNRIRQYQSWYDAKAVNAKKRYLLMRTVAVAGGAIVPALVNIPFLYSRIVATVLSLIVVVTISLESVHHYREQWKNYRSTEQFLQHEVIHYRSGTGTYEEKADDDAFRTLVSRCEGAIAAENTSTLNTMTLAGEMQVVNKEESR